ncbi:hypothetical protein GLOTRDRAFT_108929 [Gloeophyllum trabeum ATCC 11539]|uniref:EthD domain-containing protein n=1 Tax=Gloeophyllum trabeum (strain ATCC 11539 / FP-39264 / Madison 617) TaxID=670483 RepID=S7S3H2_GLOTA|nr:uncharacterized protein GLOTRDRAFT_108929 [Gloeophyllum trabeum ATCC 11539]EPQ60384.1 hypothetical protein GLOTRDRAFT_108929 [Gloeophyllum trabeum ATCC 11539]
MSTDTQAFFVVFADPGDGVPEAEFNDWYENEHIPLRVVIPSFQSWNRWAQADGQKPRYAATYDLDTPNALEKPDYALLARTRSEREKDILSKVGWVDRRVYEVLKGTPQQSPSAQKKPGIIVFNSLEVQSDREEDFHRWYNEEHIPMLLKSPGWIRTRRFVLRTWDRSGVEGSKDSTAPPKFLAVHELESDAAFQSEEYKAAGSTEWRARVMKSAVKQERRVFKFLRTWERD